ncbi:MULTISPECIES: tetratricopeptide repeat-containing protein [unclassified Nitrospina]|uniref:tetratricopeptide repeat protein n=1 Tax=unclassified Nitrospina TaxID=2638683 RepID=UPI003F991886
MIATDLFLKGKNAQIQGRLDEALEWFQKSLTANEESLGKFHPDVAFIKNSLGNLWVQKGDTAKAIKYLEDSLKTLSKICDPKHPMLAEAFHNLGKVCRQDGDPEKAIQYFEKALSIYKKNGMNDPVPDLEGMIADLFVQIGNSSKPNPIKKQAVTEN